MESYKKLLVTSTNCFPYSVGICNLGWRQHFC